MYSKFRDGNVEGDLDTVAYSCYDDKTGLFWANKYWAIDNSPKVTEGSTPKDFLIVFDFQIVIVITSRLALHQLQRGR